MKDELPGVKAGRAWPDWLPLWLAWVIGTTCGVFLTWLLIAVMAFAYVIPDPDAARIYLSYSLGEYVSERLLLGAMMGLVPGILIGLLLWVVLRLGKRQALLAVLATIVVSGLLCVVGSAGGPQIEKAFVSTLRLGILGGVTGGVFTGLCQWLILRRRVDRVNDWMWLTVAGWVMGWTMALLASGLFEQFSRAMDPGSWTTDPLALSLPNPMLFVAALFAGGAIVGLGQWLLLRHSVKRAGWWILATALSWGLAAGAGMGIITGTALILLLRPARRRPDRGQFEVSQSERNPV